MWFCSPGLDSFNAYWDPFCISEQLLGWLGLASLGWPYSYVWRLAGSWVLFFGSPSARSFMLQWACPSLHIWYVDGGRIPEGRVGTHKASLALGWRLAQYHLHPILLVSGSHKVSLDCKPGKIVSTFWSLFSGLWKVLSICGANI